MSLEKNRYARIFRRSWRAKSTLYVDEKLTKASYIFVKFYIRDTLHLLVDKFFRLEIIWPIIARDL